MVLFFLEFQTVQLGSMTVPPSQVMVGVEAQAHSLFAHTFKRASDMPAIEIRPLTRLECCLYRPWA